LQFNTGFESGRGWPLRQVAAIVTLPREESPCRNVVLRTTLDPHRITQKRCDRAPGHRDVHGNRALRTLLRSLPVGALPRQSGGL
jgi:hypothetical protein